MRQFLVGMMAGPPRAKLPETVRACRRESSAGIQRYSPEAVGDAEDLPEDARDRTLARLGERGAPLVIDETGTAQRWFWRVGVYCLTLRCPPW